MARRVLLGFFLGALILAGGCPGNNNNSSTSTTPGGAAVNTSNLANSSMRVYLTDTPMTIDGQSVDKVLVTFSDLSAHTSATAGDTDAGWQSFTLKATTVDLLTLQNNINTILADQTFPAGRYQQLRATVSSAQLYLTASPTTPVNVTIPSGVLRINIDVTIAANTKYGVLLDFVASDSLKQAGGTWRMAPPVIKVKEIFIINADGTTTAVGNGGGAQAQACTADTGCTAVVQKCCPATGANRTCANITTDNNNCGACGTVCTLPQTCKNGACA